MYLFVMFGHTWDYKMDSNKRNELLWPLYVQIITPKTSIFIWTLQSRQLQGHIPWNRLWTHTHNGIEDFSAILEHVIVPRFMTLRTKMFRKYEIHDGLYNFLLCVKKSIFFQYLSYFQNDFFMTNPK
jgi:hypothetical protein